MLVAAYVPVDPAGVLAAARTTDADAGTDTAAVSRPFPSRVTGSALRVWHSAHTGESATCIGVPGLPSSTASGRTDVRGDIFGISLTVADVPACGNRTAGT